ERVETVVSADDFQEESANQIVFDVGRTAPHRNGLTLSSMTMSDGRIITESAATYEDCGVAEVPTPADLQALGRRGVYFPCATANEITHKEGLTNAADWKTVRTEMTYDGYGNVVLNASLGVVGVDGDEQYTASEYVSPTSRWLLGLNSRVRVYNAPNIPDFAEILTYYDGEAFVGLPTGEATEGFISRVTRKISTDGRVINTKRARRDVHGNTVELIDPNGTLADATAHRRLYTFDATGFFLITTDLAVGDHVLRRESRFERDFQRVTEATQWMLVQNGELMSNRDSTSFRYDEFGRQLAEIQPGDDPATPSIVFSYALGNPISVIRRQSRSTTNGALDEEMITCLDGRGRNYQVRERIADGRYQVSGFKAYNARGVVVQEWQPWVASAGACDFDVPSGVLSLTSKFDATGRTLEMTRPGAAVHGEDTVSRYAYRPLVTEAYDAEDNLASGNHADTPMITTHDGLGRMIAIERTAVENGSLVRSGNTLHYDSTGTFAGYTNAAGQRHEIVTDLMGRTLEVRNPNFGTIAFDYDDASNVVARTDGRGRVTRRVYDAQNRLIERYDEADRANTLV
ncbi:MAG: hypothetical protein AAFV29_13180, partial [Myxococcota bacterium]